MAARAELRHGESLGFGCAADAPRGLIVELNDQVGAQSVGFVVVEGPVLNLQLQRPGAGRKSAVICRGQHLDLWRQVVQPFADLLHCSWWGNFLQLSTWFGAGDWRGF